MVKRILAATALALLAVLLLACMTACSVDNHEPGAVTEVPFDYESILESEKRSEQMMGIDRHDSPYDLAFMHRYKAQKAFLMFDEDTKQVVYFYSKYNESENTPDYGTYTGDLLTGITVTFTKRDQKAIIRYLDADHTDTIVWENYTMSKVLEFEKTLVSTSLPYLENPK